MIIFQLFFVFLGLFKGSTMNLDNTNSYLQSYLNNCLPKNNGVTTYQTKQTQEQIQLPNSTTRVDITITTNKYTLDDLSNGIDASSSSPPSSGSITQGGKTTIKIENNNETTNGISSSITKDSKNEGLIGDMSPFDEQEEWAKISEIMESFGSTLGRDSVFAEDDDDLDKRLSGVQQTPLQEFLNRVGLIKLAPILEDNGFDNIDYLVSFLNFSCIS